MSQARTKTDMRAYIYYALCLQVRFYSTLADAHKWRNQAKNEYYLERLGQVRKLMLGMEDLYPDMMVRDRGRFMPVSSYSPRDITTRGVIRYMGEHNQPTICIRQEGE